ncbi:MAG: methylmalonyl Co-A mutase-associated GTPase MeaB, partial [Alphaproteobacteria bacterium CG11_big_fil_rev_8_21_14_0_20_44_7]
RILNGDRKAVAKLITLVENNSPESIKQLSILHSHCGNAHVIGVTGAPGCGKSTLISKLTAEYRKLGKRVGIIAVDPTSPFTGGAFLGDRIRMQEHFTDKNIFIRSMGSRGSLGGIARSTADTVKILDAFGKDIIFIE